MCINDDSSNLLYMYVYVYAMPYLCVFPEMLADLQYLYTHGHLSRAILASRAIEHVNSTPPLNNPMNSLFDLHYPYAMYICTCMHTGYITSLPKKIAAKLHIKIKSQNKTKKSSRTSQLPANSNSNSDQVRNTFAKLNAAGGNKRVRQSGSFRQLFKTDYLSDFCYVLMYNI